MALHFYRGAARTGHNPGRSAVGKTPLVAAVKPSFQRQLGLAGVKGLRKTEVEKLVETAITNGGSVARDELSRWTHR